MYSKNFQGIVTGDLTEEKIREVIEEHSNIVEWAYILHGRKPGVGARYHVYISTCDVVRSSTVTHWFGDVDSKFKSVRGAKADIIRYFARCSEEFPHTGIVANFKIDKYLS